MPGQTVGEGNRRKIIRLDHETGPPVQTSPWAKGKPIYQFGFEAKSAAEVWEIRQLMHYLRGSQLAFYVPSGRKDFKPLLDIPNNSSSIDIVNIGFHQFVEGITPRSDLRVVRTDGTTSLHEISGTSAIDADSERIDVNPAITPALPLADLDRIEIVYLCRIIDDRARFVHMRPGEARVDVQLIGVPS